MDHSFRNFRRFTGAGLVDMFRMASATPAKAVRVFDRVGSIQPGKDADFVLMDCENLEVKQVVCKGTCVL